MKDSAAKPKAIEPLLLLRTARRLFDEHDLRPSVVMAQTAIEVATETFLAAAFSARAVPDLKKPVCALFRSLSLTNKSLYAVCKAISGADLKTEDPTLWRDYSAHVKRRNGVIHDGRNVTEHDADLSVAVAERMLDYLAKAREGLRQPNAGR